MANSTGYSNSEVDALLDKARALQDSGARKPLYAKMQQIVTTSCHMFHCFSPVEYFGAAKSCSGLRVDPRSNRAIRDLWKTAAK